MRRIILLFILITLGAVQAAEPYEVAIGKLYVATFNRAPDHVGLDYWVKSKLSIENIAQSFFLDHEVQKTYPPGTSTEDFVNKVYSNLFNRLPDPSGFNYWVAELNSKRVSRSNFILAVINGARNTDEFGYDASTLFNKAQVGLSFSKSGYNDIVFAKEVISGVTSSLSSVTDAFNQYGLVPYTMWSVVVPNNGEETPPVYLKKGLSYYIVYSQIVYFGTWWENGKSLLNDACYEYNAKGYNDPLTVLQNNIDVIVCPSQYHANHVYTSSPFVSTGEPLIFRMFDTDYRGDRGNFFVQIYVVDSGNTLHPDPDPDPGIITVSGKVTASGSVTGISNSLIKLPFLDPDGKSVYYSATSDENGNYTLKMKENYFSSYSKDQSLVISASKSGYIPSSKDIKINSNNSFKINFELQRTSANEIVLEVEPYIHHLGDDNYGGSINSKFQTKAEGTTFSIDFNISESLANYKYATVYVYVKGVQYGGELSLNGYEIQIPEGPSSGEYEQFTITYTNIVFHEGKNTLIIRSTSGGGSDYDDFEFNNIRIKFSN